MLCLADILPGEAAFVKEVNAKPDMRRRFQDIGLVRGTRVRCVGRSPMGDPSAFLIRGAVIAIRAQDSKSIIVEKG